MAATDKIIMIGCTVKPLRPNGTITDTTRSKLDLFRSLAATYLPTSTFVKTITTDCGTTMTDCLQGMSARREETSGK